jgi:5-methylcytosine-specific restriction endonuclease McrA
MAEKSAAIAAVCRALQAGQLDEASSLAKRDYPFAPEAITKREYGPVESTRVFIRDGFIDRYTGDRLVFPPVLRVLSRVLPADFPYHPNWKTDVTHPAYWEVGATVDHVVPVTRGGADDESNWVTTSMARNSAKMNWTLEDLGWTMHRPGSMKDWDGLLGWFLAYTTDHPSTLTSASVRSWHRAAKMLVPAV